MVRIRNNGLKYCSQCEQHKAVDAFGIARSRPDGLTCWCKECGNAKQRQKYNADADLRARLSKTRKERRLADPKWREKQRQRSATWYAERKDDPDYIEYRRAQESVWRSQNSEWIKTKTQSNQERIESDPEYRAYVNKRHRDYMQQRKASDPAFKARQRDYAAKYAAMRRANGGDYDIEDWETMCELAGKRCLACGKERDLTVDHILPVSKGGSSYLTNLQPLCGSCNASKKDRHIDYRTPQILQWLVE